MRTLFTLLLFLSLFLLSLNSFSYAATIPCTDTSCNTAFGIIPTTPGGLVGAIFSLILGFAGGAAILLIIFGGYKLMISQGNSEKTQEAKETITSAILGLLFIIFSTALLQIIGVDVLGLGAVFKK